MQIRLDYDPESPNLYAFPQQQGHPIVVLRVRQGNPLPPGEVLGNFGAELPIVTYIPFRPTAPIRAQMTTSVRCRNLPGMSFPLFIQYDSQEECPESFQSCDIYLLVHPGFQ